MQTQQVTDNDTCGISEAADGSIVDRLHLPQAIYVAPGMEFLSGPVSNDDSQIAELDGDSELA